MPMITFRLIHVRIFCLFRFGWVAMACPIGLSNCAHMEVQNTLMWSLESMLSRAQARVLCISFATLYFYHDKNKSCSMLHSRRHNNIIIVRQCHETCDQLSSSQHEYDKCDAAAPIHRLPDNKQSKKPHSNLRDPGGFRT